MPKVTKSVKKNQPVANPYMIGGLRASYPGTPLKDQGYSNKVETVATAVPRVFVTHIIRPEGNGAAYTKPMKEFFDSKGDPALMADWNCHGFKTRRAYDAEDPKKNEKLPGMKKATWPWGKYIITSDNDSISRSLVHLLRGQHSYVLIPISLFCTMRVYAIVIAILCRIFRLPCDHCRFRR